MLVFNWASEYVLQLAVASLAARSVERLQLVLADAGLAICTITAKKHVQTTWIVEPPAVR